MIGRLYAIVIDGPDRSELAAFYEKLLSLSRLEDTPEFIALGSTTGTEVVAF
ncbi:hypothetical protein [Streptomyces sp. NPDC058240]|uniref:hypothetical protein n=1 Tax=Streptomyces sp. NPDC058240 TaxID=3346396 RepID=UPI0036E65E9F